MRKKVHTIKNSFMHDFIVTTPSDRKPCFVNYSRSSGHTLYIKTAVEFGEGTAYLNFVNHFLLVNHNDEVHLPLRFPDVIS